MPASPRPSPTFFCLPWESEVSSPACEVTGLCLPCTTVSPEWKSQALPSSGPTVTPLDHSRKTLKLAPGLVPSSPGFQSSAQHSQPLNLGSATRVNHQVALGDKPQRVHPSGPAFINRDLPRKGSQASLYILNREPTRRPPHWGIT